MNYNYIIGFILSCILIPLTAEAATSKQDKPNIVFILVDDMPWWGTSVAQQEGNPQSTSIYRITPNVQKLAAQGMTFSNAYAAAGMCAPSRASIQTGLSPARHLFSGNGNFGEDCPPEVVYTVNNRNKEEWLIEPSPMGSLNSKFMTIGEKLREQGYATAHIGKWHIYGGGPELHGYDLSDGETSNVEGRPESGIEPGDPKRIFSITRKSLRFIDQQHAAGKPFYVQLSHYVEHNKQMSLPETLDEFNKLKSISAIDNQRYQREASSHGAAVRDLDTSVGILLEHLDKLGIRDNTYVIFTSDNGKGLYNGRESILRGDKWWLWEGGIRVPFIISGPGIEARSRSGLNIVGYDMLPTFYEIAGGDPRELAGNIDGESLLPIFEQKDTSGFNDRALYFHYPHSRGSTAHSAIIKGDYKLYTFYEIPHQPHLFDLNNDLGESTNLSSRMPDLTLALYDELHSYLQRVGAYYTRPNPYADETQPRFDPDSDMPPVSRQNQLTLQNKPRERS